MKMKQSELFVNWHGHEITEEEASLCDNACLWSVDWDLPIPPGIEEAYERVSGKSCVYWESEACTALVGNPNREDLPRTADYVTNGYTQGFYAWLEEGTVKAVRSGLKDVEEIWAAVAAM